MEEHLGLVKVILVLFLWGCSYVHLLRFPPPASRAVSNYIVLNTICTSSIWERMSNFLVLADQSFMAIKMIYMRIYICIFMTVKFLDV